MKKLIVLSVVFALVAGVAFAVDLGGAVIGSVDLATGDNTSGSKVQAGGEMKQVRLEGAGEVADGKFGGWIRVDGVHYTGVAQFEGYAWWKPIDQVRVIIGGFSDGFWGKDGMTAWMFHQSATDTQVTDGGDAAWGNSRYSNVNVQTRDAFYGGFADKGLALEIKPMDMVTINLALPFISSGGEFSDAVKNLQAQVDMNFDFGNVAITYKGEGDKGHVYGYFGLTAIENLGLDIGIGLTMDNDSNKYPLGLGLGVKYSADAFAVKFRTALSIPTDDGQPFAVLADVMPYYAFNEAARVYFSAGIGLQFASKAAYDLASDLDQDAPKPGIGWHVSPYVELGEEWGPKFLVGVKIQGDTDGNTSTTKWAIPVALIVSF